MKTPFESYVTDDVAQLLWDLKISLVASTYQAGKIVIISSNGKNVTQLLRSFERPMGIAIHGSSMALASRISVMTFVTDPGLSRTYPPKKDHYDALYFPIATYRTDYVDIHDLSYTELGIVGVNTAFSCLTLIDGNYSFNPIWKPPFIEKFAPVDFCHLNGMAVDEEGHIRYVTAFSQANTPRGWSPTKMHSGIIMAVSTNEVIMDSLAMPHSPRMDGNELYILQSGTGEVGTVDIKNRKFKRIAVLDGYVRGLAIHGDYLFVGISQFRHKRHGLGDIPIGEEENIKPGIRIVNKKTGTVVGSIEYAHHFKEMYDIQIIPGKTMVNILNTPKSLEHRAIIAPQKAYWIAKDLENQNVEKKS